MIYTNALAQFYSSVDLRLIQNANSKNKFHFNCECAFSRSYWPQYLFATYMLLVWCIWKVESSLWSCFFLHCKSMRVAFEHVLIWFHWYDTLMQTLNISLNTQQAAALATATTSHNQPLETAAFHLNHCYYRNRSRSSLSLTLMSVCLNFA